MNIIENYLYDKARLITKESERLAESKNTAPCKVCGKKEFVQKFRNVVGKVEEEMHGSFSLFGGSINGYIDGETNTLPVLSCRNCGNEKKVATYNNVTAKQTFYSDMHNFYFSIDKNEPYKFTYIPKIYLENPKKTKQYLINNPNYGWMEEYEFYNEIKYWRVETWIKAGFKINKKIITRFKFLWWEIKQEVYDF